MTEKQIVFLNKLAPMAINDWNSLHIVLPSITIAQAILESGWGTFDVAEKTNNLFGIRATKGWTGKVFNKTYNDKTISYRVYDNWPEVIKDHSMYLSKPKFAGIVGQTDFCIASHILKISGYNNAPFYSRNLCQVILDYKLFQYDPVQPDFNAIYRVQTSPFNNIDQAKNEANKLKVLGFDVSLIKDESTGLLYIQVGAYRARDKACDTACRLILKGYSPILKVKK